jgi:IclR family transcriptional regulator, KDG regulon repressor
VPAGALERAVDLLDRLGQPGEKPTVAELARETEMPTSTVYRLLAELEQHGFVARTAGARVTLGTRLIVLGQDAETGMRDRIVEPAAPVMRRLSREVGETVILTARCGLEALALDVVEADRHSVRLSYACYRRGPLDRGASAKVLAAWLPEEDQNRLLAATGDPGGLAEALAVIRRDGFAYTVDELDEGAAGVAAPILGPQRQLVAGLTVAGPAGRIVDRVDEIATAVRGAAQRIERELPTA